MTLNNSSRIILRISGSKTCWSSSVHRVICCGVFMMSSLIFLLSYVLFKEARPRWKQDYVTTHSHYCLLSRTVSIHSSTLASKTNTAPAKTAPVSSHARVSFKSSQPSSPAILIPSRLALHGYPDGPDQIMSDAGS